MSIKWYRGASFKSKRVLTPRRDKPTAPKSIKPKKPKMLGKPKAPGIYKPRVRLPFVTAINKTTFNSNLSASGLSAVSRIANDLGLKAGEVRWHWSPESKTTCTPFGASTICKALDEASNRNPWKTLDEFQSQCNGEGDGLWGMSHINCKCYVSILLFDEKNPQDTSKQIVFEVYTDPAYGAGRGGLSQVFVDGKPVGGGNTLAAGYAIVEGKSSPSQVAEINRRMDSMSPAERQKYWDEMTEMNKVDSSNVSERALALIKYDDFDKERGMESGVWSPPEIPEKVPQSVTRRIAPPFGMTEEEIKDAERIKAKEFEDARLLMEGGGQPEKSLEIKGPGQ